MDKQLPMINENPIVQEYMKMLLNNDKKKEYRDTEELLQYIADMEKQFQEVVKELQEVKELLNGLQNPTTRSRLATAIEKTQYVINDGKEKFNRVKIELVESMKDCLDSFKQKGKDSFIKTVNVLHFKEALGGIKKSLFIGMNKANHLVQTCDAITSEMRNAKRNLRNVGFLMLGKPVQKDTGDKNKLNILQKGTRLMFSTLQSMAIQTTKILYKLENLGKTSVKDDIRLLANKPKSHHRKVNEKMEQSR